MGSGARLICATLPNWPSSSASSSSDVLVGTLLSSSLYASQEQPSGGFCIAGGGTAVGSRQPWQSAFFNQLVHTTVFGTPSPSLIHYQRPGAYARYDVAAFSQLSSDLQASRHYPVSVVHQAHSSSKKQDVLQTALQHGSIRSNYVNANLQDCVLQLV